MNDDSSISAELLKQNGLSSSERFETEWGAIQELLKRDSKRAKALMWLALGSITVGVVCLLISITLLMTVYKPQPPQMRSRDYTRSHSLWRKPLTEGLFIFGGWNIGLGIVAGVGWFFFSRMVDAKAIKVRLTRIELLLRSGPNDDT